jgi:hypothetical protein
MKYTVVTTPVADHQLAEIWLDALDRQLIADAFDQIESQLRRRPNEIGRQHPAGWRSVAEPPLAITYRVSEDDRIVKILSVYYRP